jgi:hypothetical protein
MLTFHVKIDIINIYKEDEGTKEQSKREYSYLELFYVE